MNVDELIKQAGALGDDDKLDEALELCNKVLYQEPDNFRALFTAGSVLLKAGRHMQAVQLLKRVCELAPKSHYGWGQTAICLGEIHRYDESIRCAEKALALHRDAKTLSDCAYAHINAGNYQRADELSLAALKLDPEFRDSLIHQTNIALARRQWRTGWTGYRLTLRTKFRKEWTYGDSKEWMGEPDAVVMVTGEQGLGDEVMAASVIPDAAKRCRKLIFDCDERLGPLFRRSFPDVLVSPTRRSGAVTLPVAPTHHKSLFGLCELFRNSDGEFPRRTYLQADPGYRAMFRRLFDTWGGPVVGIAWSGGLPRTGQEQRLAGLNAFLPLLRRGGRFLSLEYRDDAQEVATFEREHGIKVHRLPWVTQNAHPPTFNADLLAAALAECSEVVGVATTSLHMASALGVPTTWLCNRSLGWTFASDELMWYGQNAQLWKKRAGESWRECVARFAESRKQLAAA